MVNSFNSVSEFLLAPHWLRSTSTHMLMLAAIIAWVISLMMILDSRADGGGFLRYPPHVQVTIGLSIWLPASHAILFTMNNWWDLWVFNRGTIPYEIVPILTGLAWLNFAYLFITRQLLPKSPDHTDEK